LDESPLTHTVVDRCVDGTGESLQRVASRSLGCGSLVVTVASSDQHVESTAPLSFVGGSGVGLRHTVERAFDNVNRVVITIGILLVVDVGKLTRADLVTSSGTLLRIIL
jgi:hypothetical protein